MNNILMLYNKLRIKDKQNIGTLPIDNRVILSKLVTDSSADTELKYVWINRAVAQASKNNTTAILGLNDNDSSEYKTTRRMTLELRKKQGNPIPFEINNLTDFNNFIENYKEKYIIIKQNYPNYHNEEYQNLKNLNFKGITTINANSEEGNKVIGGNKCLVKLSYRTQKWFDEEIEKYLLYFYNRNSIIIDYEFKNSLITMQELTKSLLIPTEYYKGDIEGLKEIIKKLLDNDFLPVFKFDNSISGYGVHYPRNNTGEYDIKEIKEAIVSADTLKSYLVSVLNKNGQKINEKYLIENIKKNGIMLQKFIKGKDYAIGFFKPLNIYNKNFSLGIIDISLSDVITDGTAHYADVLHFEDKYLDKIVKNTIFENRSQLLYLAIEIFIYLLFLNEELIKTPEEFMNVNFEDFGIQLMVDNNGEIGLIEINGRTPSHNFNKFNILSIYGKEFFSKIKANKILCTSCNVLEKKVFNKYIRNKNIQNKFIEYLIVEVKKIYNDKCQITSFQVMEDNFSIYYTYFMNEEDKTFDIVNEIKEFFNRITREFIKRNLI